MTLILNWSPSKTVTFQNPMTTSWRTQVNNILLHQAVDVHWHEASLIEYGGTPLDRRIGVKFSDGCCCLTSGPSKTYEIHERSLKRSILRLIKVKDGITNRGILWGGSMFSCWYLLADVFCL